MREIPKMSCFHPELNTITPTELVNDVCPADQTIRPRVGSKATDTLLIIIDLLTSVEGHVRSFRHQLTKTNQEPFSSCCGLWPYHMVRIRRLLTPRSLEIVLSAAAHKVRNISSASALEPQWTSRGAAGSSSDVSADAKAEPGPDELTRSRCLFGSAPNGTHS